MSTNLSEAVVGPAPTDWLTTIVGVMGNVLEWYDFALFGFFSDIIAKVFFPPEDPDDEHSNLLKSFAIFGGAFVMRPVGGLVIGFIGDKHGRKVALTRSLFLMAIPTTMMGFLPTYERAGSLSIVLLAACRLLQGISVGGQLPASLVYTVERHDKSTWGFYGALPMVAANVGTLLGNLCGALMREAFSDEQLEDFGWRIPFMSGFLIFFVAMYIHVYGDDVHTNANVYDHGDENKISNPIRVALARGNRLALFSTTLAPMLWGAGFYVSFVWMAIYMDELLKPPVPNAFWVNALALLCGMTVVLPLAGHISDKFGRIPTMTISALGLGLLGPFMVILIANSRNSFTAFLAQLILGIMLSFYGAPLCAWLIENFSPEVRLTSASLGYDLAHATAGGFSPALATIFVTKFSIYSPGLIFTIFAAISLIGIYSLYCFGGTDQSKEEDTAVIAEGGRGGADKGEEEPTETELPAIS